MFDIDVKWKVLATFISVLAVVSIENLNLLGASLFLTISIAILTGIPVPTLTKRLKVPLFVAFMVAIIHPFTFGDTVFYTLGYIKVYVEGAHFGAMIFLRVLTSVTLLNILVMTTSTRDVLLALGRLGVPKVITDIAFLMLRFTTIFAHEATTIRKAQRARLAYSGGFLETASGYGQVAGKLIMRSIDRSVKVHRAMLARGYDLD